MSTHSTSALRSKLAMNVTLISFAMLFLSLLMAYFLYRFNSLEWPPAGQKKIALFYPTLSTIFIILSSFVLQRFHREQKRRWLGGATLLGLFFLGSQIGVWKKLESIGVYATKHVYGSLLHGLTWVHAAHVLVALLLLAGAFLFTKRWSFDTVTNIGKFWHFLGIAWGALYLALFVF